MAENKKCCCGGKMKENTENEKKPVSADYARGTVGEGEKADRVLDLQVLRNG